MARRRQLDASAPSPAPAAKRLKTTETSHIPAPTDLRFLVDEDARKRKKLDAKLTNGLSSGKTTRVDESHAVVAADTKGQQYGYELGSSPDHAIGLSSGAESSDDESDYDEESPPRMPEMQLNAVHLTNGHVADIRNGRVDDSHDAVLGADDMETGFHDENKDEHDELEAPSFGDMLQARHPDTIDVHASLPNPVADRQALIPISETRQLTAPSGTSLSTVLTQALRTNDKDLLESCFRTTELSSIRATIQRLEPHHAATLLQRLAERIHKRPGRTGSLLVWVQWSLIAHGGYLAGQAELMKKLKALSRVVRERANGLEPLLHLKGKLDMLGAQLELRRNIQAASRAALSSDDEDEGAIYIEGRDEEGSSDEEAVDEKMQFSGNHVQNRKSKRVPGAAPIGIPSSNADDESESDDDMPNGFIQEGEDGSSEDDEDDDEDGEGGVLDIEAEETSDDGREISDSDEEADDESQSESELELTDNDESDDSGARRPEPKTLNRRR